VLVALLLAGAVLLTGCGGSQSPAESAADCLNDRGFLVEAGGGAVMGSSPSGVGFTLTIGADGTSIDDSGNPGNPPRRLSRADRTAIEACSAPR
jgi:hypothetical protein